MRCHAGACADALVSSGLAAAGYNSVHIDDCWMQTNPPRDANGQLVVRGAAG
jgi:alpha-galactosidase